MAAASATETAESGSVRGVPRLWLRLEGLAALLAAVALYVRLSGTILWLIPLLLLVDVSMAGYLLGPRTGALVYNLAHNWASALLVLGAGWAVNAAPLMVAGAILIGHVGVDRLAGYGLKYPTGFRDTHLGRLGR